MVVSSLMIERRHDVLLRGQHALAHPQPQGRRS
jgi:hypothetical protein